MTPDCLFCASISLYTCIKRSSLLLQGHDQDRQSTDKEVNEGVHSYPPLGNAPAQTVLEPGTRFGGRFCKSLLILTTLHVRGLLPSPVSYQPCQQSASADTTSAHSSAALAQLALLDSCVPVALRISTVASAHIHAPPESPMEQSVSLDRAHD